MSRLAPPYLPRRPHETVLYGLVKEHRAYFMQHTREAYEAPLPKYVVDEFRAYLACGDFSGGFVHTRCTSCGHDLAVAFSCKLRGLCPSCGGRRMAAIVWASSRDDGEGATKGHVWAFDATTLERLWDAETPAHSKFTPLTVARGRVLVPSALATGTKMVIVYGVPAP